MGSVSGFINGIDYPVLRYEDVKFGAISFDV